MMSPTTTTADTTKARTTITMATMIRLLSLPAVGCGWSIVGSRVAESESTGNDNCAENDVVRNDGVLELTLESIEGSVRAFLVADADTSKPANDVEPGNTASENNNVEGTGGGQSTLYMICITNEDARLCSADSAMSYEC